MLLKQQAMMTDLAIFLELFAVVALGFSLAFVGLFGTQGGTQGAEGTSYYVLLPTSYLLLTTYYLFGIQVSRMLLGSHGGSSFDVSSPLLTTYYLLLTTYRPHAPRQSRWGQL